MAGHSKWANIQHRKGAQDKRRGKIWTKISRELTVATKGSGKDPAANPRLRDAIALARSNNMPKDTINRAIAKGAGELASESYEEINYEGYGPGGAAIFLEALTDNRNRTVADLRNLFSKNGGNLGESGCVAWMFQKKGLIEVEKASLTEEEVFETALEFNAEDVETHDECFFVSCAYADLSALREGLERNKYTIRRFEIVAEPSNTVNLEGEKSEKMLRLLESLDDHDDVQRVHCNAEFPD